MRRSIKRRVLMLLVDLAAYFLAAIPIGSAYGVLWGLGAAALVMMYGLICFMDAAYS